MSGRFWYTILVSICFTAVALAAFSLGVRENFFTELGYITNIMHMIHVGTEDTERNSSEQL